MGMSLRVANAFSRVSATSHANPRDKPRLYSGGPNLSGVIFWGAHDTDILGGATESDQQLSASWATYEPIKRRQNQERKRGRHACLSGVAVKQRAKQGWARIEQAVSKHHDFGIL